MAIWTDPRGCSGCEYCGMDMDMAPYCVAPDVLKEWPNGVNINMAIDRFCGPDLSLWKQREPRKIICKARLAPGANDPQDCDFPNCDCAPLNDQQRGKP